MMRNSLPGQFQLPLLQLLTAPSPGFLSVHCWEELGSAFSVTLALEGNKASSTVLCLLLQPTKASSPSLCSHRRSSRPLTTSGAFTGLELYHLSLKSLLPPSSSLMFLWFFTYPVIHPFHPHFLLPVASGNSCSLIKVSLSVSLSLAFFLICVRSQRYLKNQEICRASLQAPCSQVQTNHFRALTVPLRK